jgi:hypothetical protein
MKILAIPLALLLLGGMAYGGYGNYKRLSAEDKAIDSFLAKATDDVIAPVEIMLDYCKIQPIPRMRKALAKYESMHGPSLERAKEKTRAELLRNPLFGMAFKNMCPLFQQEMDAMQRKLDAS